MFWALGVHVVEVTEVLLSACCVVLMLCSRHHTAQECVSERWLLVGCVVADGRRRAKGLASGSLRAQ